MKPAVFFQKYGDSFFGKVFFSTYKTFFLRSNQARIKYLRDAGAEIGENCTIQTVGTLGSEPYLVTVGNNVYFTASSKVITHDGAIMQLKYMGYLEEACDFFAPVAIGDNCFIGEDGIILKGVTLGKNCIVGAGAVVTKSFPDDSVVAGIPAKRICSTTDFYEKNKQHFIETCGMNRYKKRLIVEELYK